VQVCFRRHTFLVPSVRVTLPAAANYFSCNFLFCPSFSEKAIVALMYSALVGPLPLCNVEFVCHGLKRSTAAEPANSQFFCCAASADTDGALSLCFATSVTSDVSPTPAMVQILPLQSPLYSLEGAEPTDTLGLTPIRVYPVDPPL